MEIRPSDLFHVQLQRQTLFFYTHYTTGRTTDDDKCDRIRFTFLFFFSNLFIHFFFVCVYIFFSFLSTSTDIYNTQLPGAFSFFLLFLGGCCSCYTFVCCLPIHSRSVRKKKKTKITEKNVYLSLLQKDTALRSYFLTFLIFLFSIIIWYPRALLHYINRYQYVLYT
jgi:hypothetical protein